MKVTEVEAVGFELYLKFSDGSSGTADFSPLLTDPIFKPLADETVFRGLCLVHGAVTWPGDIDIATEALYAMAHGLPAPTTYEQVLANEREVQLRDLRRVFGGTLPPALSVKEPWLWAILTIGKRLENRDRKDGKMPYLCRHRGPLLLHASKGMADFERVFGWMRTQGLLTVSPPKASELTLGGLVGRCTVVGHVDPQGRAWSDPEGKTPYTESIDMRWHMGAYAMILSQVERIPFIPLKGALGLFVVA